MKGFLWMKNLKMLLKIALFKLSMQIYKKMIKLPKQMEAWPTFEQKNPQSLCKNGYGLPNTHKKLLSGSFYFILKTEAFYHFDDQTI